MRLRSLLFVPGDRPERFDKAAASGADALILDLEDSVVADRKGLAREAIAARLQGVRGAGPLLFVRINPLDGEFAKQDLASLAGHRPDGIVLPKSEGAKTITALEALFAAENLVDTPILPIATETPAAVFGLGSYRDIAPSLAGLTWGAEDLPAAIGAVSSREESGCFTPPYEMVRALTLFGAHAAGVPSIETVFPDFRNLQGLAKYVARGARDGFNGMMAIHPSQVAVINAGFSPSAEAIAYARAVIAAFDENRGSGVLQLDGKMIDAPHLKQARYIISLLD